MLRKQASVSVADSSQFRKVDVDDYIEAAYKEDDEQSGSDSGPNEAEIYALLSKGDNVGALTQVTKCAPLGSKDQAVKDRSFMLVMRVISSFKGSMDAAEQAIKKFDTDQVDTMMKYIYRAFASTPDENFPSYMQLLAWHDRLFAVGGHGSIIRVMTDRRKV